MHVFIDTNILLEFYGYSKERLDDLKNALSFADNKQLTIWLTQQVREEFERNRAKTIEVTLSQYEGGKTEFNPSQFVKDSPEYEGLSVAHKEYRKLREAAGKRVREEAEKRELDADELIAELFKRDTQPRTTEILQRARDRKSVGNPPGKKTTLGDEVNWETLLECVPDGNDLHILSMDGDYECALNSGEVSSFLQQEWMEKKKARVFLYKRLSAFSSLHFKGLTIEKDSEREALIEQLRSSGNFMKTHLAIAQLLEMFPFSASQAAALVEVAMANTQVRWVLSDEDVKEFFTKLVDAHSDTLEASVLQQLKSKMAE